MMETSTVAASRPARDWSKYQQAIFRDVADGKGHSVVVARAGSGKTTTLVQALRHVPPKKRVLMVAFNKSIERELSEKAPKGVEVRTLHGYGFALLRRTNSKVSVDENKVKALIEELLGPELDAERRDTLDRCVSLAKATLAKTEEDIRRLVDEFDLDVPAPEVTTFAQQVLALLDACAARRETVNFDDMLWLPIRRNLVPRKFDRVFVDETQDLNRCQAVLALRACADGGRICAVGDDRQAIYSWRGANPESVPRLIKALKANVLPLSVTYRCAKRIVEVAREVVPDLEAAPGAEQGTVSDVSEAELRREAKAGDFVLSRTNAPLVQLCLSFLADARPATIIGRDIGSKLATLVRRSDAKTIPELRRWIDDWVRSQEERLKQKGKDASAVRDEAECLHRLIGGSTSVSAVLARIEGLFSEEGDGARIVLATTHRAKGLERERVWVLKDTYKRNSVEEDNLWYVAVTRAKRDLRLVRSAA